MTALYIIDGQEKRKALEFSGESLVVGRSAESDLRVMDPFVSRKHLKISRKGEKIFIQDLNSRNGTFVNGEPIRPGVDIELPEGVPVVMGMTVLCLGEACAEEIENFLSSMDASGLNLEEPADLGEDRPMTAQRNMELMLKVTDLLTRPKDIHDILREILDCVFDLLIRIDRAAIIVLDPEKGHIKEVIHRRREGVKDLQFSTEILEHVMKLKEAFMISDAEREAEENVPETLKLLKIKSVMCIPFINRGKLNGLLYVDSIKKPYGFRGEDLHLLNNMSGPVAVAIEKAFNRSTVG